METFYDYGDKSVLHSARTFTDYSSPQATVNSTFSRKYSAYLSHKLKIFNQFGFSVEVCIDVLILLLKDGYLNRYTFNYIEKIRSKK